MTTREISQKKSLNIERLTKTILVGLGVEFLAKITPLLSMHLGAKELGVEGFGRALSLISFFEIALPFVSFGYLFLAVSQSSSPEHDKLSSDLFFVRLLHAVVLSCLLSLFFWRYYPNLFSDGMKLLFILYLAPFEMLWLHIGKQRMLDAHILLGLSKILSLAGIFLWVQEGEATRFSALVLGAGGLFNILTFFAHFKDLSFFRPSLTRSLNLFKKSIPYAMVVVLVGLLERLDILFAEHAFGQVNLALYGAPQRLSQSLTQITHGLVMAFCAEIIAEPSREKLSEHVNLSATVLGLVFGPIFFGVPFVGKDILGMIFGTEYAPMSILLMPMVFGSLALGFGTAFGTQIFLTRGMAWPFVRALVLGIGIFCALGYFAGRQESFLGLAMASIFAKLTLATCILWSAKPFLATLPLKEILKGLVPGFCMFLVLGIFQQRDFILNILLGGLAYALFTVIFHWKILKTYLARRPL